MAITEKGFRKYWRFFTLGNQAKITELIISQYSVECLIFVCDGHMYDVSKVLDVYSELSKVCKAEGIIPIMMAESNDVSKIKMEMDSLNITSDILDHTMNNQDIDDLVFSKMRKSNIASLKNAKIKD